MGRGFVAGIAERCTKLCVTVWKDRRLHGGEERHRRRSGDDMPNDARETHFDTVVVGSGFGGSVVAARLAEEGPSVADRSAALARFGKLFLGRLWDVYARDVLTSGPV